MIVAGTAGAKYASEHCDLTELGQGKGCIKRGFDRPAQIWLLGLAC